MDDGKIRIDIAQMVEIDLTGDKANAVELHRADLKAGIPPCIIFVPTINSFRTFF